MNKKTEQAPALAPEQAAELAALEAAAGAEMEAAQPGQTADMAAPAVDLAGEIKGLVLMFVGMVGPVFPSLPKIYTVEATEAAAQATAAVCNKHGWMQGGLMGEWGEEIAAAAVLAPLALATYHGVKADLAASKPKQATLPGAAQAVTDTGEVNQKTVVFGAPIPAGEGASGENR